MDDNLKRFYDVVINNDMLTQKVFTDNGIRNQQIIKLLKENKLKILTNGFYNFLAVDDLYQYGKFLIKSGDYKLAHACFLRCDLLLPEQNYICASLFRSFVVNKEYNEALNYLNTLLQNNNNNYMSDNLLCLYLLSYIVELPQSLKTKVDNLKESDILIESSDTRCYNINLQNQIRKDIFEQKFKLAFHKNNEAISNNDLFCNNFIIKHLLKEVIEIEIKDEQKIRLFIDNNDYKSIIELLNEKEKNHKLNIKDYCTLKLVTSIMNIEEYQELPEIDTKNTSSIFRAIKNNNYQLALNLSTNYDIKNNIDNENNIIHLLLIKINNLIHNLPNKTIEDKESSDKLKCLNNEKLVLALALLKNNDIDKAWETIHEYLLEIGMSKYESLLINLFKLSINIGDKFFACPLATIIDINNGPYLVNVDNYIEYFKIELTNNNIENAKIYLDIIKNYKGEANIQTEHLVNYENLLLRKQEELLNQNRLIKQI